MRYISELISLSLVTVLLLIGSVIATARAQEPKKENKESAGVAVTDPADQEILSNLLQVSNIAATEVELARGRMEEAKAKVEAAEAKQYAIQASNREQISTIKFKYVDPKEAKSYEISIEGSPTKPTFRFKKQESPPAQKQ